MVSTTKMYGLIIAIAIASFSLTFFANSGTGNLYANAQMLPTITPGNNNTRTFNIPIIKYIWADPVAILPGNRVITTSVFCGGNHSSPIGGGYQLVNGTTRDLRVRASYADPMKNSWNVTAVNIGTEPMFIHAQAICLTESNYAPTEPPMTNQTAASAMAQEVHTLLTSNNGTTAR